MVFEQLEHLHASYENDVSLSELQLLVETTYGLKEQDRELLSNIFTKAGESDVRDDVLGNFFTSLRKREIARELALASLAVVEGRSDESSLFELFSQLQESTSSDDNESSEFVTDDLEEIYNETWKSPGLRWRLNSLNVRLGSLRKGDFGFIFARPETGKTTFLSSEITYMAQQVPEDAGPILWFNNEEQGKKVKVRLYQASLGIDLPSLMSNRSENQQKYLDLTNGKLLIVDRAEIHRRHVEQLCKELKPSLIIFDQIDKIKGFAADREDLRLGAIYIWARELAKQYCPTIGVCQADGTAEGVKWLTMDHVANAKTAKQAEADFILGIGCVHDPVFEFVRFINISKNKLQGDEDSDPKLRHGRFECLIRPDIARYEDMDK